LFFCFFFFSSRRRHTRFSRDWSSDVCSSDLAYENITWAINHQIPVLSGTTGWLERKPEIERLALSKGGSFFYASNYSVGVNIFRSEERRVGKESRALRASDQ